VARRGRVDQAGEVHPCRVAGPLDDGVEDEELRGLTKPDEAQKAAALAEFKAFEARSFSIRQRARRPSLLAVLAIGALVGFLNGFMGVGFKLNALIVTLARSLILRGILVGATSGWTLSDLAFTRIAAQGL
jgi:hypothetical protein